MAAGITSPEALAGSLDHRDAGIEPLAIAAGRVASADVARLLDRYEGMETELAVLQERHDADRAVYKQLTGEEWLNKPRRTHTSSGLGIDDRLKRFG